MKAIPNGCKRNDCIETPVNLAVEIMNYFKPTGKILEPCKGAGNFIQAYETYNLITQLENKEGIVWGYCEIKEGKDFFDFKEKVDWIITNPPYSILRKFLKHSMEVSDNIIFLVPLNHFMLTARLNDIREMGFGIKEMLLIDYPDNFPKMGFALGVIYLQKRYIGNIKFDNQKHFTTQTKIGIKNSNGNG